ncbi:MAG: hypothetical protein ACM3SV_13570 [Betaproteobacteria bacterium]
MKRIETRSVDTLETGMLVVEPVKDKEGGELLPAGSELTEFAIARLRRHEIQAVIVEYEVIEDPQETEAYRASVEQRLDHLFRHAGEGEETRALYAAIRDYRLEYRQ